MTEKTVLIAFYNRYTENGSNIANFAKAEGITPTDCYLLIKMGEKYSK